MKRKEIKNLAIVSSSASFRHHQLNQREPTDRPKSGRTLSLIIVIKMGRGNECLVLFEMLCESLLIYKVKRLKAVRGWYTTESVANRPRDELYVVLNAVHHVLIWCRVSCWRFIGSNKLQPASRYIELPK